LVKRGFDIVASFVSLILLSPVFLAVAILIKVYMPGPIIFRQERTGRYGAPFIIYKFRTMIINHRGNTVSIKGESRITPLGEKLRKYKLDEFPELWNILIGDMSFVGPRPDVAEYTRRLIGDEKKILDLRPGLTSQASIKYANEEELLASITDPQKYFDETIWPDKVRINLKYYYSRSFFGDILIILKTLLRERA
jgi:lipopolysaccharide/colanic/teichoic acid biosynthesis glycosyltransferase